MKHAEEFEGKLDIVQNRIGDKMKEVITLIDSTQNVISLKTGEMDSSIKNFDLKTKENFLAIIKSIDTFNNFTTIGLANANLNLEKLSSQSDRILFPVPTYLEGSIEISWPIFSREEFVEKYPQKTVISLDFNPITIFEINENSVLYHQIIYAFKNLYLNINTSEGQIKYGMTVMPTVLPNKLYYTKTEFNPVYNARILYNGEEKKLTFLVKDVKLNLKFKDKKITSMLDFQNADAVLSINEGIEGRLVFPATSPAGDVASIGC